jgi:hypothetical protein
MALGTALGPALGTALGKGRSFCRVWGAWNGEVAQRPLGARAS